MGRPAAASAAQRAPSAASGLAGLEWLSGVGQHHASSRASSRKPAAPHPPAAPPKHGRRSPSPPTAPSSTTRSLAPLLGTLRSRRRGARGPCAAAGFTSADLLAVGSLVTSAAAAARREHSRRPSIAAPAPRKTEPAVRLARALGWREVLAQLSAISLALAWRSSQLQHQVWAGWLGVNGCWLGVGWCLCRRRGSCDRRAWSRSCCKTQRYSTSSFISVVPWSGFSRPSSRRRRQ